MSTQGPMYSRILIKLSGEALMGEQPYGISAHFLDEVIVELAKARDKGVQMGIVVGGGNIFRGVSGVAQGMDRPLADNMGMLATVINALALQDGFNRHDIPARVLSAFPVGTMVEPFSRAKALAHLERGRVVIFAAGTGNPFFTTDTASILRALEIKAEVLFKATRVDGVYDKDPYRYKDAQKITRITYDQVLERGLKVMDMAAIALARDAGLPVKVFNMLEPGNIVRAVSGEDIGSLILAE